MYLKQVPVVTHLAELSHKIKDFFCKSSQLAFKSIPTCSLLLSFNRLFVLKVYNHPLFAVSPTRRVLVRVCIHVSVHAC